MTNKELKKIKLLLKLIQSAKTEKVAPKLMAFNPQLLSLPVLETKWMKRNKSVRYFLQYFLLLANIFVTQISKWRRSLQIDFGPKIIATLNIWKNSKIRIARRISYFKTSLTDLNELLKNSRTLDCHWTSGFNLLSSSVS